MKPYTQPEPTVLVIFGASGDLAHRKLVPAMFNLFLDGWLPEKILIHGVARSDLSEDQWRTQLHASLAQFSRRRNVDEKAWKAFASRVSYQKGDYGDPATCKDLAQWLKETDVRWQTTSNKVFYLAVPPSAIEAVVEQLGKAKLASNRPHNRIVVEKPFGHDLASARQLNLSLTKIFAESQIYRIDHYLGKETVQNILAFRFANSLFEPVWNRRYIEHVQITVAEQIGIGSRGGYYEHAGALRDMVQNHLLQLMCLMAMEPPVSYEADEIRSKKLDVLRAIRPIGLQQVHEFAVRGQYGAGWVQGQQVKAYCQEEGVSPNSDAETFAAVKLFVDNWRWQDVPFYLRTGKRLAAQVSEAMIQFLPPPHRSFPSSAWVQPEPNRLVIHIQPQEGVSIRFQARKPGETMQLGPVNMTFDYRQAFAAAPPEAYETLLLDVMLGDPTQFMRADQLEAAWAVLGGILDAWDSAAPLGFPNHVAGSWGPEQAEVLIAQDGRAWHVSAPPANGPAGQKPGEGSE